MLCSKLVDPLKYNFNCHMDIKYNLFQIIPQVDVKTSFKIREIKRRYFSAAIKKLLKKSNNNLFALFQSESAVLRLKVSTKTHEHEVEPTFFSPHLSYTCLFLNTHSLLNAFTNESKTHIHKGS